jgi:hypothetical protein
MKMANAITVKTMEKDKDGKPVEQVVLVNQVSAIEAVAEVPEVKAQPAVGPTPATEAKPAVAAKPAQPESAVIRLSSGATLHVAHTKKDLAGMLG